MINLLANILGPVMRLCYHWTQNYGIYNNTIYYINKNYFVSPFYMGAQEQYKNGPHANCRNQQNKKQNSFWTW